MITHEYLSESKGTSHVQIGLDIASSGLDERGSTGAIGGNDNLISDMISQHVLVFGEDVNGTDVEVQKIGGPRGGASVYESASACRAYVYR